MAIQRQLHLTKIECHETTVSRSQPATSTITFITNKTKNAVGGQMLRWLDWIFRGGYLPSLSINYVAKSKDMEKRLPQLYYIKMKISYDLGFIAIGVAMAT